MRAVLIRMAPIFRFYTGVVFSLILATVMLGLALEQRWLGIGFSSEHSGDDGGIAIESIDPRGPAAGLPAESLRVLAFVGLDGRKMDLASEDILAEPDTLGTYARMHAFFNRQGMLAGLLQQPRVEADILLPSGEVTRHRLNPESQRPVSDLPAAFWLQLGVGLAGFWIGLWIWTLRPAEWASRCLVLTGIGLMVSAFAAAVYSTRELAIDGQLFAALSAFNVAGALGFGFGMIGLFLVYPRQLASPPWLAVPGLILGAWLAVDLLALVEGPGTGRHLAILTAMLAILILVLVQVWLARNAPLDRAALAWLGLAVVLGAGAFVATATLPTLLGLDAVVTQAEAFLFFLLVYIGVALGVARFRLFELGVWAFHILFYSFGVLLLIVLDAFLILTVVDERAPAFALSLLLVGLVWLPLRDGIARRLLHRRAPALRNLFRQVMDVALTPPDKDPQARWQGLLQDDFLPLQITPVEDGAGTALLDNGLALTLPGAGRLSGMRLEYAQGGRRLFSPNDLELAEELTAMLASAEESRAAYERGAAQERERIARDIHDNIGVQLLGALHSKETARKDTIVRETLADLRDIINNASHPDLTIEEMLADLRVQTSEHLSTAGITLKWSVENDMPTILSLQTVHTLRSIVREAVQNVLKHSGAKTVSVVIRHDRGRLLAEIRDDGRGFRPQGVVAGNGLENIRSRVIARGGDFTLDSDDRGTRLTAEMDLLAGGAGGEG